MNFKKIHHQSSLCITCTTGDVAEISLIENDCLVGTLLAAGPRMHRQLHWRANGTPTHGQSHAPTLSPEALASARELAQAFLKLTDADKEKSR